MKAMPGPRAANSAMVEVGLMPTTEVSMRLRMGCSSLCVCVCVCVCVWRYGGGRRERREV
jgi:hypothetical protein